MVGNYHPLLAGAKKPSRRTRKNATPRISHGPEKENQARTKSIAAASRGWMSEKYLPRADQVKCFFLTFPFTEPAEEIDLTERKIRQSKRRIERRIHLSEEASRCAL
jgi:hypothetical protein